MFKTPAAWITHASVRPSVRSSPPSVRLIGRRENSDDVDDDLALNWPCAMGTEKRWNKGAHATGRSVVSGFCAGIARLVSVSGAPDAEKNGQNVRDHWAVIYAHFSYSNKEQSRGQSAFVLR